jgi:mannan endo-1,4-beta-mannosidase
MKLLSAGTIASLLFSTLANASSSFAGSNLYFLHGLSVTDQANYINTLASYGAKVVRIWINGLSTGCVKGSNVVNSIQKFETTIGKYNFDTLAALDKVLAQLSAKGIKAIISPHDGNDIHDGSVSGNGCDIYCHTYGTSFYSNAQAQAQYDARIKAILTYTSPSSGKMWGNWPEAILAFDLENEPFQFTNDGANNDPSNWLCGRAQNFRKNLQTTQIKVATGGIGGDQSHNFNMLSAALKCASIDLMSVHSYVGQASTWGSILPSFESQAAANNKLIYVEEWGVATSYPSNFNSQAAAINAQRYPWVRTLCLSSDFELYPSSTSFCEAKLTMHSADLLAIYSWRRWNRIV